MDDPNEISMGEYEEGYFIDPPDPLIDRLDSVALEHFRMGMMKAVQMLAINKDGELLVGVMQVPLHKVLKEISDGKWDNV